ncbi:MAG TPA: 2-amino-4-hydroxy-6-hydroxymethyldihydropteridine diphosphokinase [Marinilabiliales bacterium]|jgi:2-amino-4-hydroxy-6-hydroxymethyldihydropteridine diphosphokinase|nr:MAG: 2-amino-4-hydroxy-6-hydroxymethyldihydropteridine diphosphokinase [Bacteroidetes bacterium GWA2_40_14]OFX61692.1 MAG: 2-amino-4-hydroxy-6-hydroxymethyldihydropteridine diphosphokinase [Bacteroidetes bacterium GWC2_40_13]OFX72465.1 MAG: 2-amino-4-hydroxy-6-hydroxymethyldihydropteridine diphosphokinase [Bacteroidetes bacterium GWD2_40_43]OFX90549.1 MAG: 2-amino-4-hydroxy-6-hydroxymethyldihydropteridine diphosphokinase [Bacteroidetes bacterium GWE2_40_63]OFY17206.1 MAG: 2-amino-4-hydroxy-6
MEKEGIYLGLGSNLGDKWQLLKQSKELVSKEVGFIVAESSVYETAPWGFESENLFLNQVLCIQTHLTPNEMLEKLLQIEIELGRKRFSQQYTSRTIDLDVLFYNQTILEEPELVIPHPKLHERKFVLVPLSEIAPGFIHPRFHKTISELLIICPDTLECHKVEAP